MDIARTPTGHRHGRTTVLVVLVGLAGTTFALGRVRAAPPSLPRASVWIDTVKRGALVRDVEATGTLVPEEVHWISAAAPARVERILVRPGSTVAADTVLLVLANPELTLTALEAERQLASVQADLANLQATLEGLRLAQESQVATLRAELADARRRARADDALAANGFLSELERGQTTARSAELAGRLEFEQRRIQALVRAHAAQLAAARQQVERQRSVAEARRHQVDALQVRAGIAGVLQELALQVGQSVAAGAPLAKVARPDRLKAEIRVPEGQAKDVSLGLAVAIDTHSAVVTGHVSRIDPAVQAGFVKVDVALDGGIPTGARPDLSVTATVVLERLDDVLYVGRPARSQLNASAGVFKLSPGDDLAVRTGVRFGRGSVKAVEVLGGLREGDRVILSDLSQWDAADRLRLQ
jgi:multidrug resistance efflux pump